MPEGTCSVATCERGSWSPEGYCRIHHYRWRTFGDPLLVPTCSIEGCSRKFLAKGYCKPHYRRWKATGDPGPAVLPYELSDLDRLYTFVAFESNGCWRWAGHVDKRGYAKFTVKGWPYAAHRVAYQALVGDIPEGLVLDHFRFPQDGCIGPSCVNPQHLRPVTQWENTLRSSAVSALNKAKDRCKRGHEFTPENTYLRPEGRRCRQCRSDQRKDRRARLRC